MLAKIRLFARTHARLSAPIVSALAVLAVLAMAPTAALAYSGGGPAGSSTGGCGGGCHGASASGIAVSITGPTSLGLGATGSYLLSIANGLVGGAFSVGTDAGNLVVTNATLTQLLGGGEITHTNKNLNAGIWSFAFDLTAPGVAGAVTLNGAGLQFNNGQGNNGDLWDFASLTVQVPEPGTALLLGMGLVGLAVVSRRRRA